MKMQRLILNKKILAINLCLLTTLVYANDIGNITENNGSSGIVRDSGETVEGGVGEDIFFKDSGTTFGSATNTSGNLIIKSPKGSITFTTSIQKMRGTNFSP